jgi:predicted phosphodiesterase
MRIAVFGDIHGNLAALEAVLEEIGRLKPDRIVVIGDVVDGAPDSLACWQRVQELEVPIIRGNHERYVYDFGTERASPEWSAPHFAPVRWAVAQCGEVVRREMSELPLTLTLPEAPELLFVHASARNDHDSIFMHTPDALLEPMFEGTEEPWIIRGHNHLPGLRHWDTRSIVNLGSVGLPLDSHTSAQFALMEKHSSGWQVQHIAVPYDVDATIRRFRESGYLEQAGPMARLFLREVATATHHFVPFLRYYGHALREGRIDVAAAINKFLSEF